MFTNMALNPVCEREQLHSSSGVGSIMCMASQHIQLHVSASCSLQAYASGRDEPGPHGPLALYSYQHHPVPLVAAVACMLTPSLIPRPRNEASSPLATAKCALAHTCSCFLFQRRDAYFSSVYSSVECIPTCGEHRQLWEVLSHVGVSRQFLLSLQERETQHQLVQPQLHSMALIH